MKPRPFALERYFARYEFSVKHVLCGSDCETRSIADLIALDPALEGRLRALRLGYIDSRGTPALREVIASMYTSMSPDTILVHSGAQEAILWFYVATLDAGDEVIVHCPCYASHVEVPRSVGATVVPWRGDAARGDRLDIGDLEKLATARTRAVVVNTPHNPTGYLMPRSDYDALVGWASARGVTLLCDEVFRGTEQHEEERLPAACDASESAVSIGVASKTYGLAGLRVGWVATKDRGLLDRIASLKDYSTICGGAPNELLAEAALRHREALVRDNMARIRRNLDLLDEFFARHARHFAWRRPRAGTVAFVKLLSGDVERFCAELVETTGVLLLPGTVFEDPENRFRIGFGREDLPAALGPFEEFMGRWQGNTEA